MYHGFKTRTEFESIPQMRTESWGHLPVIEVGKAVDRLFTDVKLGTVIPEREAVEFYGLNQMVAVLRQKFTPNEPLTPFASLIYDQYQLTLAKQAERLMAYLCLICTRESRHQHSKETWWPANEAKYGTEGPVASLFFKSVGGGSEGAAKMFRHSLPAGLSFGTYVTALTDLFNKGKYSGGYGGKKWGHVADCLRAFVVGETSAEMMVDTAYTLAHNNGPIYNKGMLYDMYSHNLQKILDIQRGGQICDGLAIGINSDPALVQYSSSGLVQLIAQFRTEYPGELWEGIDWEVVQELGAVGTYVVAKPKPKTTKFNGKPAKIVGQYTTGLADAYDIIQREVA